ncbi:bifunctional DNA primase/polymerase [Streptacidiphilus neutrinimicus]|uniref:bifunctional DNA primase/polymerase n=1 Tax=Streptacidiphilus neutrinimicus TaxID=105420 RepID=UPI0005A91780|nr:bifunctional DNA primase/polymerase [Streptacidiphilus neutrinimicus]
MPDLLAYALAAARRGWRVFPLIPGDKRPAVSAWEQQATTDPERLARWWNRQPYGIGIACGPSGLVAVDLDTPKHPDDTPPAPWDLPGILCGADVFRLLADQHRHPIGEVTFSVRTPSAGVHLYYAHPANGPELRNTGGTLGWKIDTRAHGGYVVGPGSSTPGGHYTVLSKAPIAPLPAWLAELLTPAPLPEQGPVTARLTASDRRGRYLRAAIDGQVKRVLDSAEDRHNIALYLSAVALGQLVAGGELTEQEVTDPLMDAGVRVGQGEGEAGRTIRSGLRAGKLRPRTLAA